MNEKLYKVNNAFNENQWWDDIYMDVAEDEDGETYCIFDGWDDVKKFVEKAGEILGIEGDTKDCEIERELNVSFVFSDEYTTCTDCGKVIRTSPSGYSWQPDFYVGDGFIACNKCFNDTEDYQEAYIQEKINSPKNAINGLISDSQLEELGFVKINKDSYESGYHYGQTDDPEEIYEELSKYFDEVVFIIDDSGQFDISFSAWARGEREED